MNYETNHPVTVSILLLLYLLLAPRSQTSLYHILLLSDN